MLVSLRDFAREKTRLLFNRKAVLFAVVLLFGLLCATYADAQGISGFTTSSLKSPGTNIIQWGLAFLGLALSALAWGIGKLIIIVISMLIIPILGYNEFATSNVVSIGWALVRDIVNMFVIVVLLLIAIQTMFGLAKANWQQQLPKLFIAVVAVNFSKTITLFLIDIGQVVMFTFVNALADIAAGNFIQLFGVSSFFDLGDQAAAAANSGYDAVGYLATSWLTLALLSMVLVILLMMSFIFIYRIVVLWVLIIMSPVAFFAGGVGNTIQRFGSQYQEWWTQLVGAIALGPILTFFLWLALASASQGDIAGAEGFAPTPTDEAGGAVSLYTEAFEVDKLLSLFIAMVLLVVGMRAASAQAQALGGPAASLINQGVGQRLLKGAVAAPATASYAAGRLAGRAGVAAGRAGIRGGKAAAAGGIQLAKTGGYEALRQVERRTGAGTRAGAAIASAATELRKGEAGGVRGGIQRLAGGALLAAGGAIEGTLGAQTAAERSAAAERVGAKSDTQLFTEFEAMGGPEPLLVNEQDDRDQYALTLATDKGKQKAFKKHLEGKYGKEEAQQIYDQRMKGAIERVDGKKDELLGDDKKKKEDVFKTKSRNLHLMDNDQDVIDHITDEDFKVSQLSADAVKDPRIEKLMRDTEIEQFYNAKTGEYQSKSVWDKARQSKGVSADARNYIGQRNNARLADLNSPNNDASTIAEGFKSGTGDIKIENVQVGNLEGEGATNASNVMQGLINAGSSGTDLSKMGDEARGAFERMAQQRLESEGLPPAEADKIRKALFSSSGNPASIGIQEDGALTGDSRRALTSAVREQPTTVIKLNAQIQSGKGTGGNDTTNEIVRTINPEAIQGMVKEFETAGETRREDIQDALTSIQSALDAETSRADGDDVKLSENDLKKLRRALGRADSLTN